MQSKIRRRWTVAGIIAGFLTVLGIAASGIVGNRADEVFGWMLSLLARVNSSQLPWAIVFIVVLASTGIIYYLIMKVLKAHSEITGLEQQNRVLSQAISTEHNIVELDDSLLRLLASWIPSKDHEKEMKFILAELLSDATAEFNGFVHRASILRPEGEYLKIWAHYGMPEDSVRDISFYVGSDRQKQRGVAGRVFLDQELCVKHLTQIGNGWVCDDPDFIPGRRRPSPPYRTFVVIPIIGVSPTSTHLNAAVCLGVVCFDSLQQDIFDSGAHQAVLRIFARRIAAALLIFEQLK